MKNEYPSRETVDDINLIRIHNRSLPAILPHDLFRNPLWWRAAYKRALKLTNTGQFKFDVVHCHDLDTLWPGVRLKKNLDTKLLYDAHEIFGYMISRNMPNFLVKIAFVMEKRWIQHVDFVITVNEVLGDYFKSIAHSPIAIIMNCKELVSNNYQSPKNDIFTVSYIGVLHKSRMFPEIIDVIGAIKDVRFVIAGKKENLYEIVKERCNKYENVEFLGTIDARQVLPKTRESDIVVCMINPNDLNNRIALANKQFEAMVCGRPIICTKNTYSGSLTEELKCGLSIEYNEDALHDAILTLFNDPELCEKFGKNALNAAMDKYNWGQQEKKLLEVYESLS
jgi:glycosyltransferase involved in cell wall biosynthesis